MAGIAGLDADAAVIAPEQLIVICERPACAGNGFRRDDRAELLILQGRLCKPDQVERSGIILAAVQPVRVCKVRLGQVQRAGAQARRFICRTNAASLPETEMASVKAASLPEWSIMP